MGYVFETRANRMPIPETRTYSGNVISWAIFFFWRSRSTS